jgi:putative SOS response-associated peptidase YedK
MPVVLSKDSEKAWLDPKITDPTQVIAAALGNGVTEIEHHPVSSRVNGASNDDEGLVRKVSE